MQTARRSRNSLRFASALYYQEYRNPGDRASPIEVIEVLQNTLKTCQRVFVIVDALDECSLEDDIWKDFVGRLRGLNPAASLMVTARPAPSIVKFFDGATHIDILARDADLLAFIRARLGEPDFRKHLEPDRVLEKQIEDTLVQKSQGM